MLGHLRYQIFQATLLTVFCLLLSFCFIVSIPLFFLLLFLQVLLHIGYLCLDDVQLLMQFFVLIAINVMLLLWTLGLEVSR